MMKQLEQLFSAGANLDQLMGGGEVEHEVVLELLGVEVVLEQHHVADLHLDGLL